MSTSFALLLWLLARLPALEAPATGACVDAAALGEALDAQLPADTDASALRLRVIEHALPAAQWRIALQLDDPAGLPLLERELLVAAVDCAGVEAVLAAMVARRLAELPRARFVARQPLTVDDVDSPPPARPADPRWRLGAGIGAGLGIERPDAQGIFELRADASSPRWPIDAALAVGGSYGRYPVGVGQVQVLAPRLSLGLGRDLELAGLTLTPRLLVDLGLHLGSGSGFARDLLAVLPLLSGRVELAAYTRRGFYAALGVELPLVRASFVEQGSANAYREPWLRPRGVVGFAWDLVR